MTDEIKYDDSYQKATRKFMDEVLAKNARTKHLNPQMDETQNVPRREPEVEGKTQQGHDSLVKFLAICLVVGLVIGTVIVLFMD